MVRRTHPKRGRFTVDLPNELVAKMTAFAESRGEQKSDVVRRALAFFLKCEELKKEGYAFKGFKREGDKQLEVLIVCS